MGKPENFPSETAKPAITKSELVQRLSTVLPSDSLLYEVEDLKPYECDGLTAYRKIPLAVALPENERQIQSILKICHKGRVPVVFRGAGTGLSGGALPYEHGLLLGLSKLQRILEVDPLARIARVQPGVRNIAISEAATIHGLYYAPDPSSQIACSIGGNVAENSGGVHCLKYGLTVHNIMKLRFLTIDGELHEIGGEGLDAPGYDLLALVTGSEGLLGVVTEITVKLLPNPVRAQVVLAAFDDIGKAAEAVAGIISAGVIPAGPANLGPFEYFARATLLSFALSAETAVAFAVAAHLLIIVPPSVIGGILLIRAGLRWRAGDARDIDRVDRPEPG